MTRTVVPHGAWPSPLSAELAAAGGPRFAGVALGRDSSGDAVVWFSALSDGANAVWRAAVDGTAVRVSQVRSARSRVNEYGGGGFWVHRDTLFWVEDDDQCIRRLDPGSAEVHRLTDPGPQARDLRYAAGVVEPEGNWMVVEREMHAGEGGELLTEPVNDLAWLPTDPRASVAGSIVDGSVVAGPRSLVSGPDFCVAPALSQDGRYLAWLQWQHPLMPWDAAELWAGEVVVTWEGPEMVAPRRIAGGAVGQSTQREVAVAVCLPYWSPDGRLWWCDDRDDAWVLRGAPEVGLPEVGVGDTANALWPGLGEVGVPRWVSGGGRFGFGNGFVALAESNDGLDRVVVGDHDPRHWSGMVAPSERPAPSALATATWIDTLVVDGDCLAAIAGSPTEPTSVVVSDPRRTTRHHATTWPLEESSISLPEPISFPTGGSDSPHAAVAHGLFYAPRLDGVEGSEAERAPLVVRIHGGPTANARAELSPSVQFWTTRGFAVVEVNHRGSSGFGRSYRDLLRGEWGNVEVQDCIAAAEYLARIGKVDGGRCVIRGGSAGGFTALEAVCAAPTESGFHFAAATTLYGVTDLMALASDTHKFESRYLDGLVGRLPQAETTYRERSPLHHPERIAAPVLILQGLDDPVVPPAQADVLVAAMEEAGIDCEYHTYAGEGHGFRSEATLIDALETELDFYRRVLALGASGSE